ncbi:MAG TPA: cysteine desulfuration protein SufE [Rhodospirillaceae bacterium]|jgi:cysteine desulfuration protein SufE|nr:cysteine desulfuration protein SufE [Rhodospirillaceae bacterium]MAX62882.1 cysteine desulfuration protein SufE [Rhodospirillaceae bacterium]MBB57729.1 cysteine desulfuration protein SufE [Rhodospirillaceae bacterium]HAE03014.1 cysteine desulfuration protein SufE [Rhodospirillaceae bacterium]HAJ19601.1 cysteine desulfuration protein SufE [Rhodospirillaceae bacterium]|tara:strand:+ start:12916 stop:13335 length:420 start_codon:yes stop_codon:yes gene_type:complete
MARSIDDLVEDFELFEDWEERYRYIVDLGKKLPPMPEEEKIEDNKVRGCMSQVWMTSQVDDSTEPSTLSFRADSDAFIVKGLIAILLELYSGRTPQEITELDATEALTRLGLESHLSPNRRNGFVAMVGRIKAEAETRV